MKYKNPLLIKDHLQIKESVEMTQLNHHATHRPYTPHRLHNRALAKFCFRQAQSTSYMSLSETKQDFCKKANKPMKSILLRLFSSTQNLGKSHKRHYHHHIVITLSLFLSVLFSTQSSQAQCTRTTRLHSIESAAAAINISRFNISNSALQPAGTLLASKTVPPTAYSFMGAQANTVLWQCDQEDLEDIYFLVATNGDDRVGGYWDLGAKDGLDHVYATWWKYVGIRQHMAGVELNRLWQRIPIQSYLLENNKISIRVMDIPPLQVALFKLSQLPPETGSVSNFCGVMRETGTYNCTQPNSYIQLSGNSNVTLRFAHDQEGEDSSQSYNFYGANNGFAYSLKASGPLTQTPSCFLSRALPMVKFSPITAEALNQGQSSQVDFKLQLQCNPAAISGVAVAETAISFQMSPESQRAAQALGLINAESASTYLLPASTAQNKQLASGLGMRLQNNSNAKNMLFMPPSASTGGGESAGWYPVLDGEAIEISNETGDHIYQQSYRAILEALPGQTVRPGLFSATATVVIKVQ